MYAYKKTKGIHLSKHHIYVKYKMNYFAQFCQAEDISVILYVNPE